MSGWILFLALSVTAPPTEASPSAPEHPATDSSSPVADRATGRDVPRSASKDLSSEQLRKRTGRELLAAVRESLARLADPKNEELEAAVEEMLYVYHELREDREMAGSQREYYSRKVAYRLEQLRLELKKRIARNKRLGKSKPPERVRDHEEVAENLGQRVGQANGAGTLPNGGMAGGAGRRAPNDDYGQQLVDLIQKTIAPSTWDVNGGLGVIYYWRPGRALVVRQTGEVHDQMGDALDQLRRAGP